MKRGIDPDSYHEAYRIDGMRGPSHHRDAWPAWNDPPRITNKPSRDRLARLQLRLIELDPGCDMMSVIKLGDDIDAACREVERRIGEAMRKT